jgi:tetratricopeptide (TPR) repeat protein
MSEIQRDAGSSASSELDAASPADRDAKIEQLLLVGLDHYFSAQYEQAVNVWTRALFIDRSHQRARAYIERARSALAERQRESEELLQSGVAAFHRGQSDEARRLLKAAIAGGAPADEALAVLERLNRLSPGAPIETPVRSRRGRTEPRRVDVGRPSGSRAGLGVFVVLAIAAVGAGAYALSIDRPNWRTLFDAAAAPPATIASPTPQDLPLPRRGEVVLARARSLAASGHLHEALAALDDVRSTDLQRDDADRLRADLQRQLLNMATMPPIPAGASERLDRRVP